VAELIQTVTLFLNKHDVIDEVRAVAYMNLVLKTKCLITRIAEH